MPNVTKQQEAAAAIEEALHSLGWDHLGVADGGRSNWFIRGIKPKQVKVKVEKSNLLDIVYVDIEWLNLAFAPEIKHGTQRVTVQTHEGRSLNTMNATTAAVEKCLLIFRDVLEGKGVAGNRAGQETTTANVSFDTEGVEGEIDEGE